MKRIVAVANQKGGVGKTTTAINLAASLALADQSVLLVDLDPQANLTSGVGLKNEAVSGRTVYHALTSDTSPILDSYVMPTAVSGLSLIPADRNLTGAEVELINLSEREFRLRLLLEQARSKFDFVFIDTPPSVGLLTLNALTAADEVLIPLTCEYFALEGVAELMATLERVRGSLNSKLGIAGVLLTMADNRTTPGRQVAREVRAFFKDRVFETTIPRNIRLGEAPSHGLPVILYDVRSKGAEAYVALAREILHMDSEGDSSPSDATTGNYDARKTPSAWTWVERSDSR